MEGVYSRSSVELVFHTILKTNPLKVLILSLTVSSVNMKMKGKRLKSGVGFQTGRASLFSLDV